jgi:hypothetical protein
MGVTRNLVFSPIYGFQNTDFIRVLQGFLVDDTLINNPVFFGAKTNALSRALRFLDYAIANIQKISLSKISG